MSDRLRLVSLAEILKEELEEAGQELPPDLTDEQLQSMGEDEVRAYYMQPRPAAAAAAAATAAAASPSTTLARSQLGPAQLQQLQARFPPVNATEAYRAWFPALFSSRGQQLAPAHPTAVVLCFHSSGNAEDMYTSEGTGSRRVQSALLEVCKAEGWLLLAAQLPGRAQRLREPPIATLQEVAQQLLPLVAPAILSAGCRYGVVGHSLGCWTAYELMLALRTAGLPDPAVVCFSAMPWPHIPAEQRPWRQQASLSEEQFKEECRGWDINETVFSAGMWELYQPMLRADFSLFDQYRPSNTPQEAAAAPFASQLRLFWGGRDRRVTQDMVQAWGSYVAGGPSEVCCSCVSGNHLWPIADPQAKAAWLQDVAAALQAGLKPEG